MIKRFMPRNTRDIESRDGIRLAAAACVLVLGGALVAQSLATTVQDAARSVSMNAIHDQCIEFRNVKQGNGPVNYQGCRVSEFGEFGAVGGQIYHYAIYCLMPTYDNGTCGDDSFSARYPRARGLAVFAQDPASENARLIFERADVEIGSVYYQKPAIIQNAAGTILHLPVAVDGTSAGNLSEYYLRETGRWEPIDAERWFADLAKQLPAGVQIRKGIWPVRLLDR